ncbi:hypothetical protein HK100_008219, partial [Physocladia obscura]
GGVAAAGGGRACGGVHGAWRRGGDAVAVRQRGADGGCVRRRAGRHAGVHDERGAERRDGRAGAARGARRRPLPAPLGRRVAHFAAGHFLRHARRHPAEQLSAAGPAFLAHPEPADPRNRPDFPLCPALRARRRPARPGLLLAHSFQEC